MPRLPKARQGQEVVSKEHVVEFSLYPTRATGKRRAMQSRVFISNPWGVIRQATNDRLDKAGIRKEAIAFVEQASTFYAATANTDNLISRPLLLYYSFMNLVKAHLLVANKVLSIGGKFTHGLSEISGTVRGNLADAKVKAFKSPKSNGGNQIFDEFLQVAGRGLTSPERTFPINLILPQLLPGHRLWCEASDSDERFISVTPCFYENTSEKNAWMVLFLQKKDVNRLGKSHRDIMRQSQLSDNWEEVETPTTHQEYITFQQKAPIGYKGCAADVLNQLADSVRMSLWSSVCTHSPYRKYYLHFSPTPDDVASRLPQLYSIYAFSYYLGSITRYQPYHFDELLTGPFSAAIEAFLTDQPSQFLYLMASHFLEREVAKASLV